ncbi:PREDICTED: uncharacterized protein LOC109171512 [Ipomoea nil]|uniref:uncharacterized protein LOC109171512 n=1 Tax=Ipomoea nil TaxID=35883 RepID=UPI000901AE95|nr:PREDICTED: uncharacterized protein LOC109171512 [Ipomoea nil]
MRERFYLAHVRAAMYEEFLHLQQGSSSVVEYHKRFLELARFARMLVPIELAKVEKFVAGLNYEARKALTVSKPRSLKEAYLSAADLYRVQQLQRGSFELARKRNESGGSSNFKRPRQNFQAKNAPSPAQGPTRTEPGSHAKTFACRRCGKEHAGKDCNGHVFRCFQCRERGHKVAECPQQANQRALPPSSGSGGASGGSSSRGAAGARPSGRIFMMGQSQAEMEGLVEDETAGKAFDSESFSSSLLDLLRYQGLLDGFLAIRAETYPSLVKEFYRHMVVTNEGGKLEVTSKVRGVKVVLSEKRLAQLLILTATGVSQYSGNSWISTDTMGYRDYLSYLLGRISGFTQASRPEKKLLSAEQRILVMLVSDCLLPNNNKSRLLGKLECTFAFFLKNMVKFNLPALMLQHMVFCQDHNRKSLPYGMILS